MQELTTISPALLELLQCPLGKGSLRLAGARLVCDRCGLAFPIKDGIPSIVLEEAELPAGVASLDQLKCPREGDRP